MPFRHSKQLAISIATLIALSGCGGSDSTDTTSSTSTYSAYLKDSKVEGVTYDCGSTTGTTDINGTFEYTSGCTDVTFSIGGITLGTIPTTNLNPDNIFYPADVAHVDYNNTHDTQVVQIAQLLQSLDSDQNPNNGITIDTNTSEALNGLTLNLADGVSFEDLNSSLSALGFTLIPADYAIAHYEDTLRTDLNMSIDTVPPAPAIITTAIPNEIYTSSFPITLNGERNAKVYLNGIFTGVTIGANNSAVIDLNITQEDSNVTSVITLADDLNQTSNPSNVRLFKPSIATLDAREVVLIKNALEASTDPRNFSYTPVYNTPNDFNITYSEPMRAPTTETQEYTVTADITKGAASASADFNETVPFSQELRDIAEVTALKAIVTSRDINYTRQWETGDDINITFSEPMRAPTTETQTYLVTANITKGAASASADFNETVPFSQALRDIAEVNAAKTEFAASSTPRNFVHTPLWTTGDPLTVTYSESLRNPTTEDQSYEVTATLTKGTASDTVTYTEFVPYSQALRDTAELENAKIMYESAANPREYVYTPLWTTGDPITVSFDQPLRTPTAVDQSYPVNITITKGGQSIVATYTEVVPTTNVNITLGDGAITLINDEYTLAYTVTDGGLFQKIGEEDSFIGTAFSIDASALSVNSSEDLLNYITTNSNLYGLTQISINNSQDGSLIARYEINTAGTNLYELLESFLASVNYSIDNIDFSQFQDINDAIVDFYIEYDATNASYVIIAISDKTLNVDSDITKIVNKDSIVQAQEAIVNEQESFTIANTTKKGDFLFVMDDSGSMSSEQSAAIEAIARTFNSAVNKYGLDWKATVIGTGYISSYTSLLQNPAENNISVLQTQLNLGTSGSGDERGLRNAYAVLTNGDVTIRPDSSLTIIYTSDETEHSTLSEFGETDEDFSDSYFVQNGIKYDVIIPTTFTIENDYATRMAIATGGDIANIYNYASGYDQMMDLAVRYAVAKSSAVKLRYPALASSITVFVDGVKSLNWEYDPSEYAIVFDANNTPAIGSEVSVTYSHLDFSAIVASVKTEFDLLPDDEKRSYTNENVEVTFDPAAPLNPQADLNQTYEVTVTFEMLGYTDTTTFQETVLAADIYPSNIDGFVQEANATNSYVSTNTDRYTTSILEFTVNKDTMLSYQFNDNSYDRLTVYVNDSQISYYNDYSVDVNNTLPVVAGDIVKFEYYKYYASSVADGNLTVTTYDQSYFAQIVADAKTEFDLLPNDEKRSYTNNLVTISFNPASPIYLADANNTYDVTVTFEAYGNIETTTYQETVAPKSYIVDSNTDWLENDTSFESQNHSNSSTSTLELTITKDTTLSYTVSSERSYDYLTITQNGTQVVRTSGADSNTLEVKNGDVLSITYSKDGSSSSGEDKATITIQ